LPDGVFIRIAGKKIPFLIRGDSVIPFQDYSYGQPVSKPRDQAVEVLTPAPTVGALRGGYLPVVHNSASDPLIEGIVSRTPSITH
jgi:hypothetical protein